MSVEIPKEDVAKTLDHIAAGVRDDTFEVSHIEMTQSTFPALGEGGKLVYKPSGEFMLVLTYKRKDT